jgi:hypothetical protein
LPLIEQTTSAASRSATRRSSLAAPAAPPAGEQQRPLGPRQQPRRRVDRRPVGCGRGRDQRRHGLRLPGRHEQVERDLEVHRPRPAVSHARERLRDGHGDLLDARHAVRCGDDPAHRGAQILGLVQLAVAEPGVRERHPRRDEQHRDRVRVGLCERGGGVEHCGA